MEWFVGMSDRAKVRVTYNEETGVIYCEPFALDDRDIRADLVELIEKSDRVSFDDLFHFFDFGFMVERDQVVYILRKLTR